MRTRDFILASSLLALAGLVACDKNSETAEYPTGTGGAYTTTGYGAQVQAGGYGGTPQGAGGAGATAGAGSAGGATVGNTATPIPAVMALPAQPILRGMAQRDVAGMTEDGAPIAGQFQPGQFLEAPITLQPGKCYSVIGVGIGITELDVQIIIHQPPLPEYVAAQDSGPVLPQPAACRSTRQGARHRDRRRRPRTRSGLQQVATQPEESAASEARAFSSTAPGASEEAAGVRATRRRGRVARAR